MKWQEKPCFRYGELSTQILIVFRCCDGMQMTFILLHWYIHRGLRNLNLHKGILTDSFFTALATGCFALQQLSITDAILGMGGSQEVLVRHENLQQLHVIKCRVMRIAIRLAC